MQIYKHIKDEILCGNIPSDSKLPSIRNLCRDLKVSKNTIEAAYEQLIAEGYVKSKNKNNGHCSNEKLGHIIPSQNCLLLTTA